jgi:hypothetical protein
VEVEKRRNRLGARRQLIEPTEHLALQEVGSPFRTPFEVGEVEREAIEPLPEAGLLADEQVGPSRGR